VSTQVALLNASDEPLGSVSFKHAIRMLFREVAIVEEGRADRMIGPHPWPLVIRLVRYVAATWLYREAARARVGKARGAEAGQIAAHILSIVFVIMRDRR
jgi:hypothetical protein